VLTRRESHPTSAPSANPASGARGTSAVTLTTVPSASPITAPTTRKNHVPLASFLAPIPIPSILAAPGGRGQGRRKGPCAARLPGGRVASRTPRRFPRPGPLASDMTRERRRGLGQPAQSAPLAALGSLPA